jgi:zinc protease
MSSMNTTRLLLAGAASGALLSAGAIAEIPERPEQIVFEDLAFTPPEAQEHRHVIAGGVPVYLMPSDDLPLVDIIFTFRGGDYLDPEGKTGLADLTRSLMRSGGAGDYTPAELDEEFDFLAANASVNTASTVTVASLDCLSSNIDDAFDLFMTMLREPRFDAERFEIEVDETIERMKQRNDNPGAILNREWNRMLYGPDHFLGEVATQQTIESITEQDMREFHARVIQPGNLIIGVAGDFDPDRMLSRLEATLSDWPRGDRAPVPPAPDEDIEPGVFYVNDDIPQGRTLIGHRTVKRDHPDHIALEIMNDILGGGGFTSRITNRVRSDEGLAYGAGSALSMDPYFPGQFRASFQSKSSTVALATKIVFEEIDRMRTEPVSDEELETAKNSLIETFPRTFESKTGTLLVFINDEWTDRPDGWWRTYRDKVRAVGAGDVQRVARTHLKPDDMAVLVVGDWEEIYKGDLEGRAKMSDFFEGQAAEIPLRDPLTQEPMESGSN